MNGRLVILRHAQAEPALGGPDADRPLTAVGRSQAEAVGAALAREGLLPDQVICSTARRTRQTWELVARHLAARPETDYSDAAYGAGLDDVFGLINLVDPAVGTLLYVGHNPTAGMLASAFMEEGPVPFPPASVAVVDLEVEWLYAAPGTGTGRILPAVR
ncbi:SixA phosphatase family protein [Marinactinospora thermotolerans]|uniref:Phosphohistidine phosphatase n=1 Tax=Marinactinospora thermotolerans DSM 45154 TaxID=1122192 RepID=A0A1T4T2X3_9ACTN|nr:histidine phosphatase family protein [Marinactinospora thermotolerans]SKA34508.1 phosphohistidine phosphatase [Marinactinospora thermotolerans DSM 45154]